MLRTRQVPEIAATQSGTTGPSGIPSVLAFRDLQAYLRWRNTHARHPDVLAAQRRERARIRSEKGHRWAHPKIKTEVA